MNSKKVLIVDDDERNCKLLLAMVQQEGHECQTAMDGKQALQVAQQWLPDLILLDVMMPEMDGFEVARRLKADDKTRVTPIIFLTALTDRDSRLQGLDAGAEEFLNKPIDRIELVIRMRNLLRIKEYNDFLAHHNQILEKQVREQTAELWDTRLEIVRSLGRAAEYRDNETGYHIIRMSRFSQLIAQAMGLGDTRAELLLHASPMHDIGKVGIADHILLKPGKLTPEEWQIMKEHTTIGAEILRANKQSELMELAATVAISHHERWDGSGYPNGLAGENIPVEGRIVALADVFDALTSERPYKKAWPIEEAIAEIKKQSGSHFEPRIVHLFLEMLPEVLTVRDQYLDDSISEAG